MYFNNICSYKYTHTHVHTYTHLNCECRHRRAPRELLALWGSKRDWGLRSLRERWGCRQWPWPRAPRAPRATGTTGAGVARRGAAWPRGAPPLASLTPLTSHTHRDSSGLSPYLLRGELLPPRISSRLTYCYYSLRLALSSQGIIVRQRSITAPSSNRSLTGELGDYK